MAGDFETDIDPWHMARAIELAGRGRGAVEPNPLVGALIVRGAEIIGEGWHRRFGGHHAEIEALLVAGRRATGATLVCTLEPCCHHGKTPPCTDALLAAGIRRVVYACDDPFPGVSGGGRAALQRGGVQVTSGVLAAAALQLNAAYFKRLATGLPWAIAKWAMTIDGRLATRTGESRWISTEGSRRLVHDLRGRVDAIIVGRGTAERDDPLMTARPAGPRVATRIVLDSRASLAVTSQLARTAREAPVLIAIADEATHEARQRLEAAGCEIFLDHSPDYAGRLRGLLLELGRRQFTNVLFEGGARVFGTLVDQRLVDEVHVFIAPAVVGGSAAPPAVGGTGVAKLVDALRLEQPQWRTVDGDLYLQARITRDAANPPAQA